MNIFKKALPFMCFAGLASFVFGWTLLPGEGMLIFGDDIHLTYYFFKSFFAEAVRSGTIPWWNPYSFAGQPMMAHPQAILAFYPINWLFVFMPVNVAISVYLAFHIFWAMAGMYILIRSIDRGAYSKVGAWIGGAVFGLSGFFMARLWAGHLDMIAAASFLPWVFYGFYRASGNPKPRHIFIAGLLLAMQILAGYQTMALFTLEAVAIASVIIAASKRSLRPLGVFIAGVVIAVGLSAVQLVPEQEFASRSIRTLMEGYDWASGHAVTGNILATLVSPFLYGTQHAYRGPWPNLAEYATYIGIVPLALAFCMLLFSIYTKKKILAVLIFVAIGIFSLWISFGPNAPVDLLAFVWKIVPVYQALRLPSRHLVLLVFALSGLAGMGVGFVKHKPLQYLIAIVILVELVPFARGFMELRPIPESRHDQELLELIRSDETTFRVLPNYGVWLSEREDLDFDSSMTYKIFSATGYDPSILRSYYEFIDIAGGHQETSISEHNVQVPYLPVPSNASAFLNIKYLLVPQAGELVLEEINPENVLPRFFTVRESRVVPKAQAIDEIRNGAVDFANTVLLTDGGETREYPCTEASSIEIVQYSLNRIDLALQSPCDTMLVASESYYPGWESFVDDNKSTIYEANIGFRAVFIPKGTASVSFRYFPYSFVWGGIITILTLILSWYFVYHQKEAS